MDALSHKIHEIQRTDFITKENFEEWKLISSIYKVLMSENVVTLQNFVDIMDPNNKINLLK